MSSDLISIARSGANAARIALDVTAQNIANAGTAGYVRRSVTQSEVVGAQTLYEKDVSLHGVRLSAIVRNADEFRTGEVRRTAGDLARADAELAALTTAQDAIEQPGISNAIAAFEGSLEGLRADPTNPAFRATVMESAQNLADLMNVAANALDTARTSITAEASTQVSQLNQLAQDLVSLNRQLTRTPDGSSDQAALIDRRDTLLQSMGKVAGIAVTIGDHHTATITIDGVDLVTATAASTLGVTTAPDGSLAFDINGTGISMPSGSLAGLGLGLVQVNDTRARLDAIAGSIITAINGAQATGVALDGSAGQPIFAGTNAGDIRLLTRDGDKLATAPAGAPAGSRDIANLVAMIAALDGSGAFASFDRLLTDVSSAVANRTITRDSFAAIHQGASAALANQAAVSLDDEAANLLRFQQAFQASGRVMQVARDLFDTILSIR